MCSGLLLLHAIVLPCAKSCAIPYCMLNHHHYVYHYYVQCEHYVADLLLMSIMYNNRLGLANNSKPLFVLLEN